MVSTPAPARPITRSRGARSIKRGVNAGLAADDQPLGLGEVRRRQTSSEAPSRLSTRQVWPKQREPLGGDAVRDDHQRLHRCPLRSEKHTGYHSTA